ncbi:hypothetical protein ACWG0P_14045 [Amedibacillus sp. YH-ame6]
MADVVLNHNHSGYDNFVLSVKFEDQYNSKLDLMQFCTVDNSLVGTAGVKVTAHTYKATNGTETLKMGEGNTKNIEVSMTSEDHTIEMLQNRFPWYDEELMKDPNIIKDGLDHMTVDMFNTANAKCMAEFQKATLKVEVDAFGFDAFVDGVTLFDTENDVAPVFALCHKKDVAELRKSLKDDLKYVEAFVRQGYIGTVAGVNLYISKIATEGEIILATKKAVKYLNKKGTEIVQERTDENKRLNTMYSRKYGIFYFADEREAVKLVKKAVSQASVTLMSAPVFDDSKAKAEAEAKIKAEEEAKAKLEAEAKAKTEAEAKAKAETSKK